MARPARFVHAASTIASLAVVGGLCAGCSSGAAGVESGYAGPAFESTARTRLSLGSPATVVTTDARYGVPVQWEVTVMEPLLIDATRTYPEVHCYPIHVTPQQVGDFSVDVTAAVPEFLPVVDAAGEIEANIIPDAPQCFAAAASGAFDGELEGAGAPADAVFGAPNGYTPELREMAAGGMSFTTFVASWSGLYGRAATGVRMTTPDREITWAD